MLLLIVLRLSFRVVASGTMSCESSGSVSRSGADGLSRCIQPRWGAIDTLESRLSGDSSILLEAHQLALSDGIRPYWQELPLSKGEIPPSGEVDDITAHLVPCENIGRLLHPGTVDRVLDSNNRYS